MSGSNCRRECDLNFDSAAVPAFGRSWISDGAARVGSDGQILAVNNALAAWLGTPAAEVNGSYLPCLLGRRHAGWEPELRVFLQGNTTFDSLDLEGRNGRYVEKLRAEVFRDGATCFVRLKSVAPMMWELEEMFPESCWARFVGHPMGQRLLRAETQVENLMNRWPGIVFSQRPDLSFVFVSPKVEELTGVAPNEWRRQSRYFWEVVHEADMEAVAARIRTESENASGMTSTFRIRHIQTGRVTYLWEHRRALFSGNGLLLGFEGIWLNVTRQTIAERRLLNLSWSENLGTLSMGLAHDFCNMMSGIVG
ncbi:MAG TPA: PAS domain-containing protein [Clostridia bacterium]|nr:PAS domain-containing protein [Clostridia bacterium]